MLYLNLLIIGILSFFIQHRHIIYVLNTNFPIADIVFVKLIDVSHNRLSVGLLSTSYNLSFAVVTVRVEMPSYAGEQ